MVKRWKEEMILALTVLLCATGGGYFGGKMAQWTAPPVQPVVHERSDIFGSLPPAESPAATSAEQPTVIVIVLDPSRTPGQVPQSAVYQFGKPLNQIQNPVNFI